jgi:hypothetical protein
MGIGFVQWVAPPAGQGSRDRYHRQTKRSQALRILRQNALFVGSVEFFNGHPVSRVRVCLLGRGHDAVPSDEADPESREKRENHQGRSASHREPPLRADLPGR